jgi:hypothetical protein
MHRRLEAARPQVTVAHYVELGGVEQDLGHGAQPADQVHREGELTVHRLGVALAV